MDATPVSHNQTEPRRRNIEDVRVGQRVWADNPDVETTANTAVDPATWKLVKLRAETVWDDGTVDDFNIETLQPPEWIETFGAEVGATVPMPLDLVEMGISEDLLAKVLAIERCPPIEDGPGRVVLTTVNHLNRFAFELTVEDADGRREVTHPTGYHKFYRHSDGQWVSVVDLAPTRAGKILGLGSYGKKNGVAGFKTDDFVFFVDDSSIAHEFAMGLRNPMTSGNYYLPGQTLPNRFTIIKITMSQSDLEKYAERGVMGALRDYDDVIIDTAGNVAQEWAIPKGKKLDAFNQALRNGEIQVEYYEPWFSPYDK